MSIEKQYERVAQELAAQCCRVGRNPESVCLVAVSKTVGLDAVQEAIAAGGHNFGENRPDELIRKAQAFPQAKWHFIGNIQSRRIPDIVRHASLIHSLFQEKHAYKIDAAAAEFGKQQDVLLEVNVSGEASKSGVEPERLAPLLTCCQKLEHLRVRGLMTMAPQGDLNRARSCFEALSCLRNNLRSELNEERAALFDGLSMGMSEDWREAVLMGATIVRIGRAVFSEDFDAATL